MLGVIRFFLASCVIYFHLANQTPDLGLYAVNCFYVISGYLITLILHSTYNFELSRFALNRFLRLYPTYWFACFVGFIIISTSQAPTIFHPSYGISYSFDEILSKEGANKQVISSQVDSLIKISRIWADFFPSNTSNQPI